MGSCCSKKKEEPNNEYEYCDINDISFPPIGTDQRDQVDTTSEKSYYSYEDPHIYSQLLQRNYILVAAIDFGTSYSGYAFSFRHDYERDKLKISTNLWPHNSGLSSKAPSAVLIGPDRQVKSFGYEAHSKYNELVENGKATEYLYFEKFKMAIYSTETLNSNTMIKDITGKEMPAVDVFGLVIGYLRNHLLQKLKGQDSSTSLKENMIQWIITVPAIWTEKAKQFMRLAAEKGGIQNEHLKLALEPEAASLYCRLVPQSVTLYGSNPSKISLENGTKYLVLDIGGGTVDVTAHEIQEDGTLREMYQASGGSWGGTNIDNEFKKLLADIFGSDVISKAVIEYPNDMLDLFLEFEMKKRIFKPGETERVALKCPACLFTTFEDMNGMTLSKHLEANSPVGAVQIVRDKIFIGAKTFESLYDNTVNKILLHLRKLLLLEELSGLNTVLLVGGFSDSNVIKESILSNFPDIRVIHPDDCSLAVLKGAVLYGHDHSAIKSRICKFSYGIGIHEKFKEGVHPPEKKRSISGSEICDDVFDIHLRLGERVEIDQPRLEKTYYAQRSETNLAYLDVYASTSDSPKYVTEESCNFLGSLMLELSNNKQETEHAERKVFISFHYIGSELGVIVREENSTQLIKSQFDFLG